MPRRDFPLEADPLWYKDAIIYEVHVRSFYDSVDDGMGDFAGLTQKLDYIQDLGVTAIWLLPFCPSPWRDDGYDIADYTDVHPVYGTLNDFKDFLAEAHRRGLRVITELVLNHTSDQHVWFQRSRRAEPGSHWRNFYVWSDTPDKYQEARIIFKDFEPSNWSWDPVAKSYYWHRFFAHQPDLNFDYPPVGEAMTQAMEFWLDLGVDGLRLDAVPYLFEREGTNCENLPETHDFLKKLRAHLDSKYSGRMILAEANQWPEDAIAYFGNGDECQMAFHFPVMPRLFMALRMEDRHPITDILRLTPPIPPDCQWAMFLRNHDELTLEMVTDEERDYMYRVYAEDRSARINLGIRRRLAPLLGNDRRRIELMNALLFSLPGTPVIYYGDEIGMGDNFYLGDRNGVRTPMQWNGDRNAGFSKANPQKLYLPIIIDPEYHYEALNVESQQNNPNSLLWWMKRTIAQRKRSMAFGRGSLEILHPDNRKIVAFVREFQNERILVVANLSRFTQCCELDLARFQGATMTEMFGGAEFPAITEKPYFLSLGPHAFHWFIIQPKVATEEVSIPGERRGAVRIASLDDVFTPAGFFALERSLSAYIVQRHWFLGRNRRLRAMEVEDQIVVGGSAQLLLVRVEFNEGDAEHYLLPVALTIGDAGERAPESVIATLRDAQGRSGILYATAGETEFANTLLALMQNQHSINGLRGKLSGVATPAFHRLLAGVSQLTPMAMKCPQNHTNVAFGETFVMKLYRKVEAGISPEIELMEHLTLKAGYSHAPALAGVLQYQPKRGESVTLGLLQEFERNEGDAWRFTLDNLGLFLHRVLAACTDPRLLQVPIASPLVLAREATPPVVIELNGSFLEMARLLGQRVAEMHVALASNTEDRDFTPEAFTDFYRQSLYHGMLALMGRSFDLLRARKRQLGSSSAESLEALLRSEPEVKKRFQRLRDHRIHATRTRIHGDLHLGQALYTGKDFVIIDFEGTPSQPQGERRLKRSVVRDVASMMRSFHYAAHAALSGQVPGVVPESGSDIEKWVEFWYRWSAAAFLGGYLSGSASADFLPRDLEGLDVLLESYLLERSLIEIGFEIQNRPDWVRIPIKGILEILRTS